MDAYPSVSPFHKQRLQAERTDVCLEMVSSQTTAAKSLDGQLPGGYVSAYIQSVSQGDLIIFEIPAQFHLKLKTF